jgi:Pectate lyase superfamily protein
MSTFQPPIQVIGTNPNTNPAIQIVNDAQGFLAPSGWTQLVTDQTLVTSTVSGTVLAIANQVSSGAAASALVTLDGSGNLGLKGSLNLGASDNASIAANANAPTNPAPSGSLYLRTDADPTYPRLWVYDPQSTTSTTWRSIPARLGLYNVKDYGAAGDGETDDTDAIQAALNDAQNSTFGGCVYFPAGTYKIYNLGPTSPLSVLDQAGTLTICGAGSSSIVSAAMDQDILFVSGGTNGLLVRDLTFQFDSNSLINAASGAALHFAGGGGQFLIENVTTSNTAIGLFANNAKGSGRIENCTLGGNIVGAYVSAGAQIHESHLNGGTYALICDGSTGIKMTNVALFGALSMATWYTDQGGMFQNSTYGYDVEANYGDVVNADKINGLTTTAISLTYPSSSYTVSVSGITNFVSGASAYIRDADSTIAMRGTVTHADTGGEIGNLTLTSTFQSASAGTIPSGAFAWFDPPPYPIELAGEGNGSTSLAAAGAQVHLTDCWFDGSTVLGGVPVRTTYTTSALTLSGVGVTGQTIGVVSSSDFAYDNGIYISGASNWARGTIFSVPDSSDISFSVTSKGGNSTIPAGALVTSPFRLAGITFTPIPPPSSAGGYPFVPNGVTIQGGNWSGGKSKYPPGIESISQDAIEVMDGNAVTISDANISTGGQSTGYGVHIHADVTNASISDNNISPGNSPPLAIGIEPTDGVNCQGNLVTPSASAIVWPTSTTQPFIVARNPGFNPSGLYVPVTTGGTSVTVTNTYGVPGTVFVSAGQIGTAITVYDQSGTGHATGLSSGAFHLEPGEKILLTYASGHAPTAFFLGD